ncbi:cell cycle checkpoint control protein RAD9A isoform X4 [Manis pentadactyla]|uniref:cell cycle checkpoint control protein RAD9A isoform X4 n=1 Tax=Manis pentadactyla TaxID=143292 RepID=UPI00255CF64B|nr:cell cycle checkpoint control protein RAD9A isoform X4 [Manis pentadactyla]
MRANEEAGAVSGKGPPHPPRPWGPGRKQRAGAGAEARSGPAARLSPSQVRPGLGSWGSMKCLVTGGNVKVFGKAIHSLSRIGDELYLEPLEDGLSLRTVNSSRSAYACFLFAPLFFQQYQAATPGQEPLRCKILLKSFLSVFRSLIMVEKTVEKCCISLNGKNSYLVVQLHCRYGVRKTHNLSFQDCESLQAVYNPALCPHVLRAPARVLGEAVLPFPPALAEVTLGIGRGRRVILRSYQEEEADSAIKAMVTEMSIGEEDFQQLQAQEGVAITFCLKEFRELHAPGFCQPTPLLQALSTPHLDDFAHDDIDSYMIAMETTAGSESSRVPPCIALLPSPRPKCSPSPCSEDEDEAEPSTVPGTPPPKKFRSLFFGSILATAHSPQGPSPVLAEDSEGEG